jgi:RNA polymerase subunit RPABC4/transcription elongation factor Spt4
MTKKRSTKKFTIGEMLRLYEKSKLIDIAEKQLKKKLKILRSTDFSWLTIIRNRCLHQDMGGPATSLEVKYLYYSVILILEELGYYSDSEKKKCVVCGIILSNEWNSCPTCGTRVKLICPECGHEVRKDYKICPKCSEPLYIISKQETEILNGVKTYLSRIHSERTSCLICWKSAEFCGGEPDEATGMGLYDYEFRCECENEIDEILKSRCIQKALKFKYTNFLIREKYKTNHVEG